MDQIMIDVSNIGAGDSSVPAEPVKVGDEVVLFGRQGDNSISVEEVAEPANSFNYEEVCNISRRVPRVYIKNGQKIDELNYLF